MDDDAVREGQWVVIRYANDKTFLQRASATSTIRLAHFKCPLAPLIGSQFGSVFEAVFDADHSETPAAPPQKKPKKSRGPEVTVKAGKLVRLDDPPAPCGEMESLEARQAELEAELCEIKARLAGSAPAKKVSDNRSLVDSQVNQRLRASEISQMKDTGVSGEKIISALLANSRTFEDKTEESKEKYIRRKHAVHSTRIRVLRCCAQTIGEILWEKSNTAGVSLGGLRYYDTMPHVLTHAGIHSGGRVLAWDDFNGYLLGCILERMGGRGELLAGFIGPTFPDFYFLQYFNFSAQQRAVLRRCDVTKLLSGASGEEQINSIRAAEERRKGYIAAETKEEERRAKQEKFDEWLDKKKKDVEVYTRQMETFRKLREEGADSLVVLTKASSKDVFMKLWPYLAAGRPFCMFSEYLEPVTQLREKLERESAAIGVRVIDLWFRKHQILPNRSHPLVMMNGASGYLLFGTKVTQET